MQTFSGADGQARTVSAADPLPIVTADGVRGRKVAGSITFSRPADTTPYTALDVIGSAISAILEIPLGIPAGAEVQLDTLSLTINRTTIPSGMTSVIAHLYTAVPTALADNDPFSSVAADRALYAGSLSLSSVVVIGGGFLYAFSDYGGRKVVLTTNSIFVVLQTAGGYTPASVTEHILRIRGVDLGA